MRLEGTARDQVRSPGLQLLIAVWDAFANRGFLYESHERGRFLPVAALDGAAGADQKRRAGPTARRPRSLDMGSAAHPAF